MSKIRDHLASYLRPYQKRFLTDDSRRIIVLKSRQIGFSEAAAIKSLVIGTGQDHHDVYLASLSYREAKELLRKVAKWVRIFSKFIPALSQAVVTATQIHLPNGSRIIALPALKIRGRSGTIILDEFAFYGRDREVWAAISPAAETQEHMRIILISTPFGRRGVFHEIWTDEDGVYGDWSRHHIDIYQAAQEGFPVDPEELRKKYPSDVWEQEFCCSFSTDNNQYFPHDLLLSSLVDSWADTYDAQAIGIDLASTRDASCMVPVRRTGDFRVIGAPLIIKPAGEARDYSDQEIEITSHLDAKPYDAIVVDGTGEGAAISQNLLRRYPRVHVWKSGEWQKSSSWVMAMKRDLEDGSLRIFDDQFLLRAFAKVRRRERSNRTVAFEMSRDQYGHGDEFSAALMAYAGSQQPKSRPIITGSGGRRVKISF